MIAINGSGRKAMNGARTILGHEGVRMVRPSAGALALALYLALSGAVWAMGGGEGNAPLADIVPVVTGKNGVTEISFALGTINAAVLKTTRAGVTKYTVPIEHEEREIGEPVALTLAGSNLAPNLMAKQPAWDFSWLRKQELREGDRRSYDDALNVTSPGKAVIRIEDYGVETTYELTWIGPGKLRRLVLVGTPEFVRGENDFFALGAFGGGKSYAHKALSLLATLFPAGELEDYLAEYLPSNAGILPLTTFSPATMPAATKAAYDKAYERLKGAIGAQFLRNVPPYENDDTLLKFPTVSIDKRGFRQLYGELGKGRNPYLLGYLIYSYQKNKPLLSYPAKVKLGKQSSAMAYDWAKYREINATEGDALARSALRYLVGAVEYSQVTKITDIQIKDWTTKGTDRAVYAVNEDRIKNWIAGGVAAGTRDNNYLAGGFGKDTMIDFNPIGPSWIRDRVATPFKSQNGAWVNGNPLPYAPYGLDTPRSFAYKMTEQLKALRWIKNPNEPNRMKSTKAEGHNGKNYVDYLRAHERLLNRKPAFDITKDFGSPPAALKLENATGPYSAGDAVKPYLPGAYLPSLDPTRITESSYYGPDTIAGIDSAGLLVGALSMTSGLDGVADGLSRRLGRIADLYNQLSPTAKAEMAYRVDTADAKLTAKGLDAKGLPAYYTKEVGSRSATLGATLTWSDLERMTTVVPDLSLIRVGDLIAGRHGGRPHIGIVVGLGWTQKPAFGADPESWYSKVYVVSVRSGLLVASLGTWGNAGGTFGGFTMDPETYQIRRLVTYDASRDGSGKLKEDWEAMDGYAASATWTIKSWEAASDEPPGIADTWPWIPNTGEPLYMTIKGSGKTIYSDNDAAAFTGKRITLNPTDYGADLQQEDGSNIINNKGPGIEFGYVKGATLMSLVKFPLGKAPEPSDEYASKVYKLTTKADGTLVFGKLNAEGQLESEYTRFWIRPIDEKARTGDDWTFAFKVEDNEGIPATLEGSKRLAIYDKKLLWRANLYVDEGAAKDWNNLHPWNAPPDATAYAAMSQADKDKINWWNAAWGYNEWNVPQEGNTGTQGGQVIPIMKWNHWIGNGAESIVNGSVSYGWGSQDAAPSFNSYLNREADIIAAARDAANANEFVLTPGYSELKWENNQSN